MTDTVPPQPAAARRREELSAPPERSRHLGQVVAFLVTAVIAWKVVAFVAADPKLTWGVWRKYLFSGEVLHGLVTTVELSVIAMAAGIVLGVAVALMRLSANRYLRTVSWMYVWVIRSVPLLLQILIIGNLGLFFDTVHLTVPLVHLTLVDQPTNKVFTPFVASVVALSINEAPYMAEIVRGGILSVAGGQTEAAEALAMTRAQTMRHVVLPQALRTIIPPTGNQVVNMLKATSLVSVVAGGDLLTVTTNLAANNFRTLEMLFVATFWYLVLTVLATAGQSLLERRSNRSRRQAEVRGGNDRAAAELELMTIDGGGR
ncbi:putative polar amino acid ABC transporter inner membrane subunit [Actinacidiphila reveromycinica]|uniref:Putative polar amino acid ABC transporter inner membrane subunit n=1 Tax=Actinacidiphila reveromycinica TaxID=659352 RepID=A0A7U3VLF6_9ACTN|nr:amino acid ABC transporter permease [Streptomyces sp. SN-593]BBA95484.1 putative polar amino acid ABC transporter inner membrane subunit [Streptomyces sp. SN-593]